MIGFAIAWQIQTPGNTLPASAVSASPSSLANSRQSNSNQVAALWNNDANASGNAAQAQNPGMANAMDEQKLHEQAMADPAVLRDLIHRYDTERDQNAKDALKSILSTIHKPETQAFFTRLATSSDASQRKEGFEMLKQTAPDSPEVRNLLKQALASEQSPAALAEAVAAMKPVVVAPAESEAIIAQLRELTRNADPAVRSQSVLQLGQWDKNGSAQESLAGALNDSSPEVRQAAIFAVAQSGARTDSLKASLIGMVNNQNERKEIRGSALQVLERFSLTKEEYANFTQARSQIGQ